MRFASTVPIGNIGLRSSEPRFGADAGYVFRDGRIFGSYGLVVDGTIALNPVPVGSVEAEVLVGADDFRLIDCRFVAYDGSIPSASGRAETRTEKE